MHALIVGPIQVGKSTLIHRVLDEIGMPVFGFETKKEEALADQALGSPVYIYEAGKPHVRQVDNLVAHCGQWCGGWRKSVYTEAFDRFAPKLASPPAGHIVVMDEIGFMESSSPRFCSAIMHLLDGGAPVIAAVKCNSTPFLDAVKRHPNCRCFEITPENREALFEEVLAFVKQQSGGK